MRKHLCRSCISTARYSCISAATKNYIKRKRFWTTPPCRPGRYINRESCISTTIKTEAEALLVDTAVSTWAVYPPRSEKQNHLWRSCISPARYSCISTALKKKEYSASSSGRHGRVDQGGVSIARAVLSTAIETEAKLLLMDTAVSTWAMYQPQLAKGRHL